MAHNYSFVAACLREGHKESLALVKTPKYLYDFLPVEACLGPSSVMDIALPSGLRGLHFRS